MAKTNATPTLIASVSNAATAAKRGAIDLRAVDGGIITFKIANGSTGPTLACECRVLVAHNTGATPSTGAPGADWKTVARMNGGLAANLVTEGSFTFGPEVQHLEIEFNGNTGQAVTVEAFASTYAY